MKSFCIIIGVIFLLSCKEISKRETFEFKALGEKIDETLEEISSLHYFVKTNSSTSPEGTTHSNEAIVFIRRRLEDSLGFNYYIYDFAEGGYLTVYNDLNLLFLRRSDSLGVLMDTKKRIEQFVNGGVVENYSNLQIFKNKYFSEIIASANITERVMSDTIIMAEPCFKLSLKYNDSEDVTNNYTIIYVRKRDYFPIGQQEFYEVGGLSYIQEKWLYNVLINPELDDLMFNIEFNVLDDSKLEFDKPAVKIPLLEIGQFAPEIVSNDLNDNKFQLSDYRGKVVVLDFWYTSCLPCIKLIQDFQLIKKEMNRDDVIFVGVNGVDKKERIAHFMEKKNMNFKSIYNAKDALAAYKIAAYPAYYVIDKEGKIQLASTGYSDQVRDIIIQKIKELL